MYLCFVDLLGACTVLPIPLAATIQGIYVGRAKRLLNTVAKVQTQAQLFGLWKDKDRVDAIIVYMMAVEWELKNTLDKLQLEINR